jgi:hypothetical protein
MQENAVGWALCSTLKSKGGEELEGRRVKSQRSDAKIREKLKKDKNMNALFSCKLGKLLHSRWR